MTALNDVSNTPQKKTIKRSELDYWSLCCRDHGWTTEMPKRTLYGLAMACAKHDKTGKKVCIAHEDVSIAMHLLTVEIGESKP